jgi:hypothetical protein
LGCTNARRQLRESDEVFTIQWQFAHLRTADNLAYGRGGSLHLHIVGLHHHLFADRPDLHGHIHFGVGGDVDFYVAGLPYDGAEISFSYALTP